jgi:hypothetical protein
MHGAAAAAAACNESHRDQSGHMSKGWLASASLRERVPESMAGVWNLEVGSPDWVNWTNTRRNKVVTLPVLPTGHMSLSLSQSLEVLYSQEV